MTHSDTSPPFTKEDEKCYNKYSERIMIYTHNLQHRDASAEYSNITSNNWERENQ